MNVYAYPTQERLGLKYHCLQTEQQDMNKKKLSTKIA